MKFKYIFFSVLLFSLTSCETDVEDPTAVMPPAPYVGDSGSADFSSYVSLGASNASRKYNFITLLEALILIKFY